MDTHLGLSEKRLEYSVSRKYLTTEPLSFDTPPILVAPLGTYVRMNTFWEMAVYGISQF